MYDAVVVGSGPNGLSAAITIAEAGRTVLVLEAQDEPGGGARTAELAPGVVHDVCSAVHPFGVGSPAFRGLEHHGLRWAHPEIPFAHPLDGGRAAIVTRDLDDTCDRFATDGPAWRNTIGWAVRHWDAVIDLTLSPPIHALTRPLVGWPFGWLALRSAAALVRRFETDEGRAAIAGLAAHSAAPLGTVASAGVAIGLGASAHTVGWPFATGGSGRIADALVARLRSLGGDIQTSVRIDEWDAIPAAGMVVLDTSPEAAVHIAGHRMTRWVRRRCRSLPRGPGVFKIDVALDGPVPWANEDCRRAGTLHLGGSYEEIAASEAAIARGEHPEQPFVMAAQPSIADPSRAPTGTHLLWAYCRVPSGSSEEMTGRMVAQVERFAPGFERRIGAITSKGPAELETANENLVGGDITGGALSWRGLFARPKLFRPYRLGPGLFLCSASTPPGAGVHGMCGRHAARSALRRHRVVE